MTAACRYDQQAKRGIRLHVRSSPDGLTYDTADLHTFDVSFVPGQTCRQTFRLDPDVRFVKILIENLDSTGSVSDIAITATLGG